MKVCAEPEPTEEPHSMIHNCELVPSNDAAKWEKAVTSHGLDRFKVCAEIDAGGCGRIFRVKRRQSADIDKKQEADVGKEQEEDVQDQKEEHVHDDDEQKAHVQDKDNDDAQNTHVHDNDTDDDDDKQSANVGNKKQRCAMKIVYAGYSQRMLKIAQQEARILRRLASSDSIEEHKKMLCMAQDMWRCQDTQRLFIVFPLRPMDLFDYMKKRSRRPLTLINNGRVMRQIVEATACLHERFGIIHNDIKPENILIDPATMQCWLTDFGGACEIDSIADDPCVVLTFMYASPERIAFKKPRRRRKPIRYDKRSDSWSLGVLAAELANGRDIVDTLITEDRWNALMEQSAEPADTQVCELLDEPKFVEALAPSTKCRKLKRCRGLRAFLFATLAFRAQDRLCAAELLERKRELYSLYAPLAATRQEQ